MGVLLIIIIDTMFHGRNNISKLDSRVYLFLFLALFLHSIPTGIALGFELQNEGNSALLNAVIIHHIPEGIILMTSVMALEKNIFTFLFLASIISLSVGAAMLIGIKTNFDSLKLHTIFTGAAIGTIGYVTIYEILWKSLRKLPKYKVVLYVLLGTISILSILLLAS